ncbi:MAG: isoprenylcysteine carboxylmethyltransferase family protein [Bacteroidales bacterium]|jgi:protein-S-isoprenylcysteine O-methyltransferase Ste14|nr:isoprenylcysteine carboxylmethyltransferase family protein [Bacteroidales bacterium]
MSLVEEFDKTGNWFFRYRSYLPVILYPLATLVMIFNFKQDIQLAELTWSIICLSISLFGLLIRILVIGFTPRGTSGRNTSKQVADTLNTKGIYSVVRHPLYLGNFLMWFGIILYVNNFWFAIVCTLLFWLYYERIMFAEEQFLKGKFGDQYIKWSLTAPPFFPKFKGWKNADLEFSFRNVLKREYNGLFAIGISFAYLNLLKNYLLHKKILLSEFWLITLIVTFLIFIILRTLKKKTNLLHVEGR